MAVATVGFLANKKRNKKLIRCWAIRDTPGSSSLTLSQRVLRNFLLQLTRTRCCCAALVERVVGTDKDGAGGGGSQRAVARFLSFSLKNKQNPSTFFSVISHMFRNLSGNLPHNMSCIEVTSFTATPLHPDIMLAEGFITDQLWVAKTIHRTKSFSHFITSLLVTCCFSITHWLLVFVLLFTSLFLKSLGKPWERMDAFRLGYTWPHGRCSVEHLHESLSLSL